MTLLAGQLRTTVEGTSSPYLTGDIDTAAGLHDPRHETLVPVRLDAIPDRHYPVSMSPRVQQGAIRHSYFDDYYNRIHVVPSPINLGNIVNDKQVLMSIWNAYLVDKSLTATAVPADTGTFLTPPIDVTALPFTMTPLRELIYTLNASLAGSPSISGDITITVSGETLLIPISGRRVVVFAFPPNWSSPLDETIEYNSWVLPAQDGSEQTGSNWGNQPRRSFGFTIVVKGVQMQRLENMMYGWLDRFFGVPHWPDKTNLTADVVAGATFIPCDTTLRAFEDGGLAMLFFDADNYEAFQVESVVAGALNAASGIGADWPQGTRVYPISVAQANETMSGSYQTDDTITAGMVFDCDPTQSPVNSDIGPVTPTYRGEELYLGKLNWKSPLPFSYQSDRVVLDYKTGAFSTYSRQGYSKQKRKHNWWIPRREDGSTVREWIARREGVAHPLWMPTGNADMTLAAPILSGSFNIDVRANEYAELVGPSPARQDIIILLRDGSYVCRRIDAAEIVSAGVTRLTLDATVGQNISAEEIKRISFLGFYRLEANTVAIRWITDETGTVEADLVIKPSP